MLLYIQALDNRTFQVPLARGKKALPGCVPLAQLTSLLSLSLLTLSLCLFLPLLCLHCCVPITQPFINFLPGIPGCHMKSTVNCHRKLRSSWGQEDEASRGGSQKHNDPHT